MGPECPIGAGCWVLGDPAAGCPVVFLGGGAGCDANTLLFILTRRLPASGQVCLCPGLGEMALEVRV